MLSDVLFKKGKSAMNHPGNAHFRSLIQLNYEQKRLASSDHDTRHTMTNPPCLEQTEDEIIQSLVVHFFDEVQKGKLRILMWNEKRSWWSILSDERLVRKKIENTVISSIKGVYSNPRSALQDEATMQESERLADAPVSLNNFDSESFLCHQELFDGVVPIRLRPTIGREEDGNKRRRLSGDRVLDSSHAEAGCSSGVEASPGLQNCYGRNWFHMF